MKTIIFVSIFGFVILILSLLLILVNTIPNDPIRKNVAFSISPVNYQPSPFGPFIRLDNYTECIAASMGLDHDKKVLGPISNFYFHQILETAKTSIKHLAVKR